MVQAADRRGALGTIGIRAVSAAAVIQVRQPEERLAVAAEGVVQRRVQVAPAPGIEADYQAGDREPAAERPRPDAEGTLVEPPHQSRQPAARITRLPECAHRDAAAVGQERLQVGLEAGGTPEKQVAHGERGVRDTVERERADTGGEKVRVYLAKKGPVAPPEVGQLAVTERGTDSVHVARRAGRVDERKKPGARLLACLGHARDGLDVDLLLLRVVEHRVGLQQCVELRVGQASHRCAAPDAPLVERDQVESLVQALEADGVLAQEVDAG